jgi:hypothetical protein
MAPSETVRKSLAAFERVGFGLVPATESGAGKKLVHGGAPNLLRIAPHQPKRRPVRKP